MNFSDHNDSQRLPNHIPYGGKILFRGQTLPASQVQVQSDSHTAQTDNQTVKQARQSDGQLKNTERQTDEEKKTDSRRFKDRQ